MAIRRGGDKLSVANLEAEKYPAIEFETDPAQVGLLAQRESALRSNKTNLPCLLCGLTGSSIGASSSSFKQRNRVLGVIGMSKAGVDATMKRIVALSIFMLCLKA